MAGSGPDISTASTISFENRSATARFVLSTAQSNTLADLLTKGIGPEKFEKLQRVWHVQSQCRVRSVDVFCTLHMLTLDKKICYYTCSLTTRGIHNVGVAVLRNVSVRVPARNRDARCACTAKDEKLVTGPTRPS